MSFEASPRVGTMTEKSRTPPLIRAGPAARSAARGARARGDACLGSKPLDRPAEPLVQGRRGAPSQKRLRARSVEAAPGLPVRHGGIPMKPSLEPGEGGDLLCQLLDRDLEPGADV